MEALSWQEQAACRKKERDLFFEVYEGGSDSERDSVKRICHNCPVEDKCFAFGEATRSTGVFGGEYMKKGVPYYGSKFN